MADKKISQLTASTTPLAGTEELAVVQSGSTKKTSVNSLFDRAIVVNESGADVDFRIESDTDANALFVQGSNGYVGIKNNSPDGNLTIGNTSVSGDLSIKIKGDATSRAFIMFGDSGGAQLGDIMYDHNTDKMRFRVNNVERLSIDSSGNITANTGNLVIGTAGKGIDFSADGQAAGMTSELLDDYEEGTWTPVIADAASGGNESSTNGTGHYTKVGRLVTISAEILSINTSGLTAGNKVYMTGLPFTAASLTGSQQFTAVLRTGEISFSGTLVAHVDDGNNYIAFHETTSGGSLFNSLIVSDITSGQGDLRFSLTYFAG